MKRQYGVNYSGRLSLKPKDKLMREEINCGTLDCEITWKKLNYRKTMKEQILLSANGYRIFIMDRPSTTCTDHQEWYRYAKHLEWKLEQETQRADRNHDDAIAWESSYGRIEQNLEGFVEVADWMKEINVDGFDRYKTALRERMELARETILSNSKH